MFVCVANRNFGRREGTLSWRGFCGFAAPSRQLPAFPTFRPRSGEMAEPPAPKTAQIKVCARVRPCEDPSGEIEIPKRYGNQKSMQVRQLEFSLDWCFDTDATQEEIFNQACRESITGVLDGYNAAILAYGQTGSGKTCVPESPAPAPAQDSSVRSARGGQTRELHPACRAQAHHVRSG